MLSGRFVAYRTGSVCSVLAWRFIFTLTAPSLRHTARRLTTRVVPAAPSFRSKSTGSSPELQRSSRARTPCSLSSPLHPAPLRPAAPAEGPVEQHVRSRIFQGLLPRHGTLGNTRFRLTASSNHVTARRSVPGGELRPDRRHDHCVPPVAALAKARGGERRHQDGWSWPSGKHPLRIAPAKLQLLDGACGAPPAPLHGPLRAEQA